MASAAQTYFSDLVIWEPELVAMYDAILPRIDRALGAPPQTPAATKQKSGS